MEISIFKHRTAIELLNKGRVSPKNIHEHYVCILQYIVDLYITAAK